MFSFRSSPFEILQTPAFAFPTGQNDFLDHPNMSRAGLSTFNPKGPRGDDGTPLERFEALMHSPAYSLLLVRGPPAREGVGRESPSPTTAAKDEAALRAPL